MATDTDPRQHDRPWPQAVRIKAWLKAFVPADSPGTVDGVGAASGRKLLAGPCSWFNDCFHTDNRGFSADAGASCRMHSEFELDLTGHELHELHYCGETVEYDCEDGEVECRATASTAGMRFSNLRWADYTTIRLDLVGSASNPCLRGSLEIGYAGTFTVDLANRAVMFDGMVNGYPAFEAYAAVNGGAGATVFTYGPRGGPAELTGVATDRITGIARF